MPETRNPRRPYRRPTILLLMGVVASIGIALGAVRYRKDVDARARQARWKAAPARAEARVAWGREMQRKGHVPAATVTAGRSAAAKFRAQMQEISTLAFLALCHQPSPSTLDALPASRRQLS